jgi:DNA-binding CsgD family transcriptional regulator
LIVTNIAVELASGWQQRLSVECTQHNSATHNGVVQWLIGVNPDRYTEMTPEQLTIATQAMDYRYRILLQRYLGVPSEKAYKNLMQRLGSLAIVREKIRSWLSVSRDRQRTVVDVLQEVVQEMLQGDKYIRQQVEWISQCTKNPRLRDALMLATLEEYCLRPIRNQPLLAYRFVNYLRRSQRGGVTNVPRDDLIKVVSDSVTDESGESSFNFLDQQVLEAHQEQQEWEETQLLRSRVKDEMLAYLEENLGVDAKEWLRLYLIGKTPEEIAQQLDMDIKQVYRLREKISYHAVKVFAVKSQPEMVAEWLKTSLQDNSMGLTVSQWQDFNAGLEPKQQRIMAGMKNGESVESIAKDLGLKTNQVVSEWSQIYLAVQEIRSS